MHGIRGFEAALSFPSDILGIRHAEKGSPVDPIAVLYENEAWMAPLFASLDEAGALAAAR